MFLEGEEAISIILIYTRRKFQENTMGGGHYLAHPSTKMLQKLVIRKSLKSKKKKKQGNQGDVRKIHVTRQFFEASGPQGHFLKKVFR